MPVEFEIKHILNDRNGELLGFLSESLPSHFIEQFYVTPNNRFRRTVEKWDGGNACVRYLHTFKLSIEGRLLEVETDVSKADYEMATAAANERLLKRRFKIKGDVGDWDIDFLYTALPEEGGSVYFSLAEIETEEDARFTIPTIILPFIELVVPHADSEKFSNRLLADRDYALRSVEMYQTNGVA